MRGSVLKRYALAYIKKSGSGSDVQEFLRSRGMQNIENWSDKIFENAYKQFMRYSSINEQQHSTGRDDGSSRQQVPTNGRNTGSGQRDGRGGRRPTDHQARNESFSFLDCLLLQCWIDSLLGRSGGHTTVNNITNINNYSNSGYQNNGDKQSREDKKKDAEDSRKLLALGIAAVVVCIAFHTLMCFGYNSSRKAARKSEKLDYLDNKLKMFRNIEFAVGAISLAALIGCAINPVLPVWGLVILGINSLVCLAGGVAFHMKHEKESENIEKAKEAVGDYHKSGPIYSFGDSSHHEAPPPYSPQDPNAAPSAPPKSECSNFYQEQHFRDDGQQYNK